MYPFMCMYVDDYMNWYFFIYLFFIWNSLTSTQIPSQYFSWFRNYVNSKQNFYFYLKIEIKKHFKQIILKFINKILQNKNKTKKIQNNKINSSYTNLCLFEKSSAGFSAFLVFVNLFFQNTSYFFYFLTCLVRWWTQLHFA